MRHILAPIVCLLLLVACEQPSATVDDPVVVSGAVQGARIGYVNADSILNGYIYLAEQTDILRKREEDATASLERKQRKLQEQVAGFQRRAQSGNMTPKAIENETAVLTQKDQELQAEYQRLSQEFQSETFRLQNELGSVLEREVKAVQADKGFDYVLSYGGGSPVIGVNEDYNITSEVLARMNAAGPVVAVDTIMSN